MKPHKKLNAWIKSFEFVKDIYRLTDGFPQSERFGIISQLRRAAVSVPVNIAEGSALKSKKEFIYFLHISLGSITEIDTLLFLSIDLGFSCQHETKNLIAKADVIGKLIHGLIKKLELSS